MDIGSQFWKSVTHIPNQAISTFQGIRFRAPPGGHCTAFAGQCNKPAESMDEIQIFF
jgi:hypothetical protein